MLSAASRASPYPWRRQRVFPMRLCNNASASDEKGSATRKLEFDQLEKAARVQAHKW